MVEGFQQPCFVENVGRDDEDVASIALNQIKLSSFLDVESVHLEFGNVTMSDVIHF
jgi:hypothetical protein